MKLFNPEHSRQKHLHSIMLPSILLTFMGSNYLCLAEVGPLLEWNTSFYWLYTLMILGFGVSWVYAGAMNQAYQKVLVDQQDNEDSLLDLQAKLKTLSRKEREVLNLILQHKSNQQISDELFISPSTLKSHINHIYKKLEVSRRQEILEVFG